MNSSSINSTINCSSGGSTNQEWIKSAIVKLLQSYQVHKLLYDVKHQLYYNKSARNRALNQISDDLQGVRQGTTQQDVLRKIQTLRTQYGQEMAKIDKFRMLGKDFVYVPSVWWFEEMKFIKNFIKKRNSLEPITKTRSGSSRKKKLKSESTDDDEQVIDEEYYELEEINEEVEERRPKKAIPNKNNFNIYPDETPSNNTNEMETIEYTVIDDTNLSKKNTFVEITTSLEKTQREKIKNRSKGIGKFVTSLMSSITDDKLFISTQKEVLNLIYDAQMKQLQLN